MSRFARCERDTKETEIVIELDLDGTGQYDIHTGIGFFDHMLEGFAFRLRGWSRRPRPPL